MEECQFCKIKDVMRQIRNIIDENISNEYGFYIDDYITEVYNAVDNAEGCPTCECRIEERT